MINALDRGIILRKFELQSRYYIPFRTNTLGKGMNPLLLPYMRYIVPLVSFWKDRFSVK